MAKHPKIFPNIFVNMVRAGETGGVLDEVLLRVADHFEREAALKAKIKSAMTYPIAMGGLVMRRPRRDDDLRRARRSRGCSRAWAASCPLPTQILVDISELRRGAPAVIVARRRRSSASRSRSSAWKAHASPAGCMWDTHQAAHAGLRSARAQDGARAVHAHVRHARLRRRARSSPRSTSSATPRATRSSRWPSRRSASAIKEGETIAKPLSESPVFPSMLVQMIAVGEETGALDAMLNKVADFYDDEVSTAVDGLTSHHRAAHDGDAGPASSAASSSRCTCRCSTSSRWSSSDCDGWHGL